MGEGARCGRLWLDVKRCGWPNLGASLYTPFCRVQFNLILTYCVQINAAVLRLKQDGWIIDFQLDPNPSASKPSKSTPRWLASLDPLTFVDLDNTEGHFTRFAAFLALRG